MNLKQRLGYYLGGFSIGLIFLVFFFSGKRTSCAYGPEARVLKNINTKPLVYSEEIERKLNEYQIDSLLLKTSLTIGDVKFNLSDTKRDSCKLYVIENDISDSVFQFKIENCDSLANLIAVNKK